MPSVLLNQIFEADRALRAAERELLDKDPEALTRLLAKAVETARGDSSESGAMRLERLADLCSQVPGPLMADALVSILDHEEPTVRHAAGEALLDVAYDYYAEVARAIDRALDEKRTGPAMCELPFLLAEVGEPGAVKQLKRFLKSESPEVVASAIEASVELLDGEMLDALRELGSDERVVTMVDFEDETTATLGELANEAVAALESLEDL
ncbi:MAG: hypothetical protein AB8H86_28275 [Polyangiales bacterium]